MENSGLNGKNYIKTKQNKKIYIKQHLLTAYITKAIFQGDCFNIAEKKDMSSSSSVRTPKSQLVVEQPLTGGHKNPLKKDTQHPRTKEKLQ